MRVRFHTGLTRLAGAAALLALAACSGDANPVRDAALATGLGSEPRPAPDFVAASRPNEIDYIRPGVATRAERAKTPDEVKAFEATMEKRRATNDSRAAAARELGARSGPSPQP